MNEQFKYGTKVEVCNKYSFYFGMKGTLEEKKEKTHLFAKDDVYYFVRLEDHNRIKVHELEIKIIE